MFHDTVDFLSQYGSARYGAEPEEIRVGFWILEDGVRPNDDTLAAIQDFPRPTDITGTRSWFGLVEQVAYGFSKSSLMLPFRDILKQKSELVWTPDLQRAFEEARLQIVNLVKTGVKSFQLGAWTCLITNWSRTGIGFVLWQKCCKGKKIHPSCCKEGLVMILCDLSSVLQPGLDTVP